MTQQSIEQISYLDKANYAPNDILLEIFKLSIEQASDLATLNIVCKRFHTLLQQDSIWQHAYQSIFSPIMLSSQQASAKEIFQQSYNGKAKLYKFIIEYIKNPSPLESKKTNQTKKPANDLSFFEKAKKSVEEKKSALKKWANKSPKKPTPSNSNPAPANNNNTVVNKISVNKNTASSSRTYFHNLSTTATTSFLKTILTKNPELFKELANEYEIFCLILGLPVNPNQEIDSTRFGESARRILATPSPGVKQHFAEWLTKYYKHIGSSLTNEVQTNLKKEFKKGIFSFSTYDNAQFRRQLDRCSADCLTAIAEFSGHTAQQVLALTEIIFRSNGGDCSEAAQKLADLVSTLKMADLQTARIEDVKILYPTLLALKKYSQPYDSLLTLLKDRHYSFVDIIVQLIQAKIVQENDVYKDGLTYREYSQLYGNSVNTSKLMTALQSGQPQTEATEQLEAETPENNNNSAINDCETTVESDIEEETSDHASTGSYGA